jgi:hypothetical protein
MRRAIVVVVAFLMPASSTLAQQQLKHAPTIVPFKSFVVLYTDSTTNSNAPLSPSIRKQGMAVRADGSFVLLEYYHDPHNNGVETLDRKIYDFQNSRRIEVNTWTHSVTTISFAGVDYASRMQLVPAGSCGGKLDGKILGVPVEYVDDDQQVFEATTKQHERSNTVLMKDWKAPSLGCASLRSETSHYESGKWIATNRREAIVLQFQPVDEFFTVGPEYVERTPEETSRELSRLYPEIFGPRDALKALPK